MSSRFVSAGTIAGDGASTEHRASTASTTQQPQATPSLATTTNPTSIAWEKAQAQLEADRRARDAARKAAVETGAGQSLYDVLQANKAAKQSAFEEANRIKNQFRALDDDEVDFLDDIAERERREEEQKRREEEEGLKGFRDMQQKKSSGEAEAEDNGKAITDEDDVVDEWSAGPAKKRKRDKEPVIKGIKRRVSAINGEGHGTNGTSKRAAVSESAKNLSTEKKEVPNKANVVPPTATVKSKMGLVAYGSDDDDDDD